MGVCMHGCAHAIVKARGQALVSPLSSTMFFEERSLAEPGTHRLLDLMARDPLGYLDFLYWDCRSSLPHLTSYTGVDLNTCFASITSTSPAEFRHLHGGSQPSVSIVLGHLISSSVLCGQPGM